jgi:hypothetical protein
MSAPGHHHFALQEMSTMAEFAAEYMNQTIQSTPDVFQVRDWALADLKIEKTAHGYDVTVEPSVSYPATFRMSFETKAKLAEWLAQDGE